MKIKINYGVTIPTQQFENLRPKVSITLDSKNITDAKKELDKTRGFAFDEISKIAEHVGVKESIYLK
jgi:hypothetical protein